MTNFSPLTSNRDLRRHFSQYGPIISFDPQIDKENGSALGILLVKYETHEEAKRCVEKEHGRKGGIGLIAASMLKPGETEEWTVVFDWEGLKMKALLKELEEKKKRDREEKRKGASGAGASLPNDVKAGTTPLSGVGTPQSGIQSPAPSRKGGPPGPSNLSKPTPGQRPPLLSGYPSFAKHLGLPPRPPVSVPPGLPAVPIIHGSATPMSSSATENASTAADNTKEGPAEQPSAKDPPTLSVHHALRMARAQAAAKHSKPAQPKPTVQKKGPAAARGVLAVYQEEEEGRTMMTVMGADKSAADREKERQEVVRQLAENGHEHVKIHGHGGLASVLEEDVREFLRGFEVDKVGVFSDVVSSCSLVVHVADS